MSFFKPQNQQDPEKMVIPQTVQDNEGEQMLQQQYLTELKTQTLEGIFLLDVDHRVYSDWARSVSFSPDGTKVASGSYDHTVKAVGCDEWGVSADV